MPKVEEYLLLNAITFGMPMLHVQRPCCSRNTSWSRNPHEEHPCADVFTLTDVWEIRNIHNPQLLGPLLFNRMVTDNSHLHISLGITRKTFAGQWQTKNHPCSCLVSGQSSAPSCPHPARWDNVCQRSSPSLREGFQLVLVRFIVESSVLAFLLPDCSPHCRSSALPKLGWSLSIGAEILCPHFCTTVALGCLPGLVPLSFWHLSSNDERNQFPVVSPSAGFWQQNRLLAGC